jgi:class 3 adenylate cyclase
VVSTVKCAVVIQKEDGRAQPTIDPKRRMQFRIGINIGDVICDEARIYGDGINIAARLESIAERSASRRVMRMQSSGHISANEDQYCCVFLWILFRADCDAPRHAQSDR